MGVGTFQVLCLCRATVPLGMSRPAAPHPVASSPSDVSALTLTATRWGRADAQMCPWAFCLLALGGHNHIHLLLKSAPRRGSRGNCSVSSLTGYSPVWPQEVDPGHRILDSPVGGPLSSRCLFGAPVL